MQQSELKIPKERIAVLIGQKGKIKKELEKLSDTKLKVDSNEGDIFIEGEDSLNVYIVGQAIKAIGRGFNPKVAQRLINEDCILDIINIEDYSKGSKSKRDRLRGRVIGTEGLARQTIEKISDTYISIYGKTVAIIGDPEHVALARTAIAALLRGAKHGPIFKSLEINKKELLRRQFEDDKKYFKK